MFATGRYPTGMDAIVIQPVLVGLHSLLYKSAITIFPTLLRLIVVVLVNFKLLLQVTLVVYTLSTLFVILPYY